MPFEKCGKKREKIATLLFLALLVPLVPTLSCTGKTGPETGTAGSVATSAIVVGANKAASPIPHVEAPLTLPAIEREKEGILLAYRHTQSGFLETNGFDTLIYRFLTLPGGWLSGAVVSERRLEGEKTVASYQFSYAGDAIMVSESTSEKAKDPITIVTSPGELVISGAAERILLLSDEGNLTIKSRSGEYREEYMVGPKNKGKTVTISRSGVAESEGHYEFPGKGKVVYTERKIKDATGAEELMVSLWVDEKDDFRFSTEGIVPYNEVYTSGLKQALTGDHALINLALVDLVLGKGRNIRPVLAYAISGKGTSK